ncbi:DUF58 domain-containing protein [Oscillochloris sp. ZM17-4]|uniref:DUF58 domain-containing protein n=1 Tax=Oscillochloris sp. ZM17-4 TaxID=2866714 RepID=UPI001C734CA6|nr:DUF58 domain-containing protein [Oscillochloris sp. ZM17-4]MBX0330741.1 DUF58 domain-containing protein [Oscillochloris sp. ZM17-4]
MTTEPLLESSFIRKLDNLSILTRRAMAGDIQGERRSPRRGSSVEFADFRPYTSGDDIRQIDWNLYARAERFYLKLFVAEEELSVHLLVDTSASMDWGAPNKLQYAKRLAGAYGYIALSNLDRVSVSAFGAGPQAVPMPSVRGKRGAIPLFSFLQRLAPGKGGDLAKSCRTYMQTARTPGPLLLCSDLLDPGWKEALGALSSRPFEVTVMHVLAPQEIAPDLDGDFTLVDVEGGDPVEISADIGLIQRYREGLERWREEIESFCNGRGMSYLAVDTSVPVDEFVLSQMRRRGVLR